MVLAGGWRITLSHPSHKHIGTSLLWYSWSLESLPKCLGLLLGCQNHSWRVQLILEYSFIWLDYSFMYYINTKLQLPIHHHFTTLHLCYSQPENYLVEWAIATHGMYESPFCVRNVHSLSYPQFQGIDGLYVSYKQCHWRNKWLGDKGGKRDERKRQDSSCHFLSSLLPPLSPTPPFPQPSHPSIYFFSFFQI